MVILDDVVLPEIGATWKQASMDLAMMTMLAARERTEREFSDLLAKAGLRLRDMWTYDEDYGDTLIVAERMTGAEPLAIPEPQTLSPSEPMVSQPIAAEPVAVEPTPVEAVSLDPMVVEPAAAQPVVS